MMPKKIVIDSNLWISFLISSTGLFLKELISEDNVTLLLSLESIAEFEVTTTKKKFVKYFDSERVQIHLSFLRNKGQLIDVVSNITKCRDPKDNFLLNLSIDGKADYLITGDKDLLVLKKIENTKIVTLKEFENIIKT